MPDTSRPINELTGVVKRSSVLVRGFSHMEIAKQAGLIPGWYTEIEYSEWAKGPRGYSTYELWTQIPGNEDKTMDDFLEWLGFVQAAAEASIIAEIAAAQAAAAASAAAAAVDAGDAETARAAAVVAQAAAVAAKVAAEAAQAAAEAAAASITQATATQIWTGTNNTAGITSLGLKSATAFVPSDASEVAANVWTPDLVRGRNRSYALGANTTLAAPANPQDGQTLILKFKEDATGGRTLTINAIFDFGDGGSTINTGANKVNRIIATYDATENKWMATMHKAA